MMLDFRTAGESHGKGLLAIVENLPAGVEVDMASINLKLARRQAGYGRGGRMEIEKDQVKIVSGIRQGRTLGSPVGLLIYNQDWKNWTGVMAPGKKVHGKDLSDKELTKPRPGHADLAGAIKYNFTDMRNILERASARETAVRTAVGGLLDNFLTYFKIEVISHVIQLGKIKVSSPEVDFFTLKSKVFTSPLHCYDQEQEEDMKAYIDEIREKGDSLGGVVEIVTTPLPVGLGSHTQWNQRLDGRLAQALLSIPAVKGVEIGPAFANATRPGSDVHDEIFYNERKGFYRQTNRAGGVEGGISNGEPLIIRIAMKPIPTLSKPLKSVDVRNKKPFTASIERSDITALPAAGVVGEAMVAFVLAQSLLEKFGGDSIDEVLDNYHRYLKKVDSL